MTVMTQNSDHTSDKLKRTRSRGVKKVHQLRVKSKSEFIKFEKNLPQLIQLLKNHSVTKKLTFSTEIIKDPNAPKIRFKYSNFDNFSETDITVEPGSFEFDFEDDFHKINELTAYKASKLLQEQIIKEVNIWNHSITLFTVLDAPESTRKSPPKKSKKSESQSLSMHRIVRPIKENL
jgi:hypothetical protein